jgi:hypothetical protein
MPSYNSMIPAAALLIALVAPAGAQQSSPYPGAAANIRESKEYSALLRSNPAFRKKREAIECGPINADGRRVTVTYHRPGDTFPMCTSRSMIEIQARWTEADLWRLSLLR